MNKNKKSTNIAIMYWILSNISFLSFFFLTKLNLCNIYLFQKNKNEVSNAVFNKN